MLTEDQKQRIQEEQDRYPHPKTGIIHSLFIAQEGDNSIEEEDVEKMGELLGIDPAEIWSVASFYTMINQEPTGRYKIQVCDNLPCLIEGAAQIVEYFENRLNIENGETTADDLFTLETVECLGSCGSAPICQVNDEAYHENLTPDDVDDLLDELRERAKTGDGDFS